MLTLLKTKECINNLETVKAYYVLTKPGIVRGNLITAVAGFLFASKGVVNPGLLVALTLGVTLIVASGCVFNNYLDRNIDKKMDRTKTRALVVGSIKPLPALVYASILGLLGLAVLLFYINFLTAVIGVVAFVSYLIIYGYAKRKTMYGTLVGSVPGSLSLVAGYTAVTNSFDITALILFIIMAIWQMPHFYAIAIYRLKDYKAAGLPVISLVKGIKTTKLHTLMYIIAFGISSVLLSLYSYAGYVYLIVMLAMSAFWLWYAGKGFKTQNDDKWAKGVFGISLLVLLVFCLLLSVNNFLT